MKILNGPSDPTHTLADPKTAQLSLVAPYVTIIVTNYNYDKFIIPCLKSIAAQTYTRYKCVIVDDCSTDSSVELIKEFLSSDQSGRFSLVCHETNGGQMAAFKTGLKHAEGVFVTFVDADDLLFDTFLSSHIEAHMEGKAVAFTSSNQYQINERNEITAGTHADLRVHRRNRYISARPLHTPFWIWATTSSMIFRRSVLELIMPDNCSDFRVCADNYICHFSNLLGGSLLLADTYGCYRRHGANYFSCNAVVGGRLPTGDMQKHPKHHILRLSILAHILKNHDSFLKILSGGHFEKTLLLLTGPYEILCMKRKFPGYFTSASRFPYLRFAVLATIMRLCSIFNNHIKALRYVLSDHNRSDSKL